MSEIRIGIDDSKMDTARILFHGDYNYDYYQLYINGLLYHEGLLFSSESTANPHTSVSIIYDQTLSPDSINIFAVLYTREAKFDGQYSPLWSSKDIKSTSFLSPPQTAKFKISSKAEESKVLKISNYGGLSISILKQEERWD